MASFKVQGILPGGEESEGICVAIKKKSSHAV